MKQLTLGILVLATGGCGSHGTLGVGGHDSGAEVSSAPGDAPADSVIDGPSPPDHPLGDLSSLAEVSSMPDRPGDDASPPPLSGACNGAASSDLPGVSLDFPDDRCSYSLSEVAAGITIKYQVVVAQTLGGLFPAADDWGHCDGPATSGLIVGFELSGNTQRYCLCDVGYCPSQNYATTATAGTYPVTIAWDGRNWYGPSDTSNPKGAAFPPGAYTLTLTARGSWGVPAIDGGGMHDGGANTFVVAATRFITITP